MQKKKKVIKKMNNLEKKIKKKCRFKNKLTQENKVNKIIQK